MDKGQEKKPSEEIRANVSKESNIRHLYTQLLYILFTHRHFFTQTLLHTNAFTNQGLDTHLKDLMSYGVLIGPSSMFVFLVNSMTSGNEISERPCAA